MWWQDINLRSVDDESVASLLARAEDRYAELDDLQQRHGADSPLVLGGLEDVGQLLFRAASGAEPAAFAPRSGSGTTRSPSHGRYEDRDAVGYHLVVEPRHLALPWTALHNGVRFLLESYPICASTRGSRPDTTPPAAQSWMLRWHEDVMTEDYLGPVSIRNLVERYRPEPCAEPGICYLSGWSGVGTHTKIAGDPLAGALETTVDGRRLARLEVPAGAPTPAEVVRAAHTWQALHYAGRTSVAAGAATGGNWDAPVLAPALEIPENEDLEVVGVDPVTCLLDQINARADAGRLSHAPLDDRRTPSPLAPGAWQLEDGVLSPEDFALGHATPALVFSNSYLGLPALGARFLQAGASVCVGPQLVLDTPRSVDFAAAFYRTLARGLSAAEALRIAALACRADWGGHHPGWLSYGIVGSGTLALQYL